MKVYIEKGVAVGQVRAPSSKSMAHRLLICAACADGHSVIRGVSECDDVKATLSCLSALGVPYRKDSDTITVDGIDMKKAFPRSVLNCGESGSTLRFLIPVALLCEKNVLFSGGESLMRRPMSVYEKMSDEKHFMYSQDGNSVMVRGPLMPGLYRVQGNVSSQFISGLLFALPQADADSTVSLIPPVESRSYINMTISALSRAGIDVQWKDDRTLFIPGNQKYKAFDAVVEGDYSGAAFTYAFNALGGDVVTTGLCPDSIQGDKAYERYFAMLCKGTPTIYLGDCPDLGPVLFAVAAAKYGGVFTGTARLRIKESDRCEAMAEELRKFGVSVSAYEDEVVVYPVGFHAPAETLCGHSDHRIVMALSVLLTLTGGCIDGTDAVSKSYPGFFDDICSLGIKCSIV